MATLLGLLAGLLFLRLIEISPYLLAPIVFLPLLIYQISAYRHFWGRDKGHFEYCYREFLIDRAAGSLTGKTLGIPDFLWGYLADYNPILLDRPDIKIDSSLKFIAFLKLAQSALRAYDCRKEIEYLKNAVSLRSGDLVANYRLAHAMERVGNGPAAISTYQAALSDPFLHSAELKEFITAQIKRVQSQGPTKKPPIPGLRYMTY